MPESKKLYMFTSEACWGEVWFDKDVNVVSYVHENDAHYRSEYQSFIAEFFGGEVVVLDIGKLDKKALKKFPDGCEDHTEYLKAFKNDILKLIKESEND